MVAVGVVLGGPQRGAAGRKEGVHPGWTQGRIVGRTMEDKLEE